MLPFTLGAVGSQPRTSQREDRRHEAIAFAWSAQQDEPRRRPAASRSVSHAKLGYARAETTYGAGAVVASAAYRNSKRLVHGHVAATDADRARMSALDRLQSALHHSWELENDMRNILARNILPKTQVPLAPLLPSTAASFGEPAFRYEVRVDEKPSFRYDVDDEVRQSRSFGRFDLDHAPPSMGADGSAVSRSGSAHTDASSISALGYMLPHMSRIDSRLGSAATRDGVLGLDSELLGGLLADESALTASALSVASEASAVPVARSRAASPPLVPLPSAPPPHLISLSDARAASPPLVPPIQSEAAPPPPPLISLSDSTYFGIDAARPATTSTMSSRRSLRTDHLKTSKSSMTTSRSSSRLTTPEASSRGIARAAAWQGSLRSTSDTIHTRSILPPDKRRWTYDCYIKPPGIDEPDTVGTPVGASALGAVASPPPPTPSSASSGSPFGRPGRASPYGASPPSLTRSRSPSQLINKRFLGSGRDLVGQGTKHGGGGGSSHTKKVHVAYQAKGGAQAMSVAFRERQARSSNEALALSAGSVPGAGG